MGLLEQITTLWLKQIELAKHAKKKQFGDQAARSWKYLGRDYQPLYYEDGEHEFPNGEEGMGRPVIVGKSQEYVSLMLPYIHAKVPHRLVTPSRPPLPQELLQIAGAARQQLDSEDTIRAWLLEFWLNYISHEGYDLATEARTALPEALVKGQCVVWHELTNGPYGRMPASFYDTIDSLYVDADAERLPTANWICRKRRKSVWKIADQWGLDVKELRGQYTSAVHQAASETYRAAESEQGDVGEYYEIWSRMGVGHKFLGAPAELQDQRAAFDALGQFVYLVVMPGVKHPLNIPPKIMESPDRDMELKARLAWPIAFFEEVSAPWPCSNLQFYPNAHDPWAQSPLANGLQCQVFLDSLYKFVMRRVRTTSRDIIVTAKSLAEALKDAIESGKDQEIVEVDGKPGEDLKSLIEILQFPTMNTDIWSVVEMVERQFERATGMTPLLSGAQPTATSRSATDTQAREGHLTSRPDDLADMTEEWMSKIAAKEAQATRLYIEPPYELFGEARPVGDEPIATPLAAFWTQLVMTDDPVVAASELSYTVEAGSGRRKNKQKQASDAAQMVQNLSAGMMQYGFSTGNFQPYNGLIDMLGKASDMPVSQLMLPNIPPPLPEESSGAK